MRSASVFALALFASTLCIQSAQAQPSPGPQPAALPAEAPAARDIPYRGVLRLQVDATDLDHHIFHVHETVPVTGGEPLTLLYPKWLPGEHAPTGPISDLAGLTAHANGQPVAWTRDTVDVFAFHLTPPPGAKTVELDFEFVSPVEPDEGRVVMTPEMLSLEWSSVSLYPAGYFVRRIPVEATVTVPEGWAFGTALETAETSGATTAFKTVSYETLVDSPLLAGRYFKNVDLDPGGPAPVSLHIVADDPEELDIKPDALAAHRSLVQQAYKLFGSHHYDHYDFLLSLSERMGGIGLEHHRSSEDGTKPKYFTDWAQQAPERDLLPHEYTHSWNGKFRRPFDLWTPDYSRPMQDSLLWVYEGQTQYWGIVLAARSGLLTAQEARDAIALTAAALENAPGRSWKALQDTTNDPIVAERRPIPWRSFQRSEDYYSEGELIWLDADTLIRQRSGGQRSLDDFARGFFGVDDGAFTPKVYTFDDVVAGLNAVEPYDWAGFLRARLDGHTAAPLDGIDRSGYRLVFTDIPSGYQKQGLALRKTQDFTYSLGFSVGEDAKLTGVLWNSLAFKAGLTVGTQIIAVGGVAYDADRLKDAITAAKSGAGAIDLLVRSSDHFRTVSIAYRDGLRYPHLEKVGTGPAPLDAILAAKP
jgi:predicted metalloprotease with PDZ domain